MRKNAFTNSILAIKNGNIISEIFTICKFCFVGSFSTFVHISILLLLGYIQGSSVLIANSIAFLTAFFFSFTGHYLWTFNKNGTPKKALFRFAFISVAAFFVNIAILALLLKLNFTSPQNSAIFSSLSTPIFSFFLSRFWGFKN